MAEPAMMMDESATAAGAAESASSSSSASSYSAPPQAVSFSSTSVSSGTTSTLFGVRRPASIPSDGEPHKLVIGAVAVTPSFAYKTSPRAAAVAFLTVAGGGGFAVKNSFTPTRRRAPRTYYSLGIICR